MVTHPHKISQENLHTFGNYGLHCIIKLNCTFPVITYPGQDTVLPTKKRDENSSTTITGDKKENIQSLHARTFQCGASAILLYIHHSLQSTSKAVVQSSISTGNNQTHTETHAQ
jgi:hypothetical protein